MLPHPWQRLADLAQVTLHWHQSGPRGRCLHGTQDVSIRTNLSQAERRSALAHELTHLTRGPAIRGYVDHDEQQTRLEAARWLIPFDRLVEAMVWASDDHELAEELWVDVHTVRSRLEGLTDAESALLNERLDAAERTFPG